MDGSRRARQGIDELIAGPLINSACLVRLNSSFR